MNSSLKRVPVADLSLDLKNYRTVRQTSERAALQAMVSTRPAYFWAIVTSLIDDGYMPTENLIVIKTDAAATPLRVREGNRRVAAMKVLHGLLPTAKLDMPDDIAAQIRQLSPQWRIDNADVPCLVYEAADSDTVDKLVARAHGKGEKAGRDGWNAVATARHNRDYNRASEPGLDLLERYLEHGRQVTNDQRIRWSGVYPVTVLTELAKRLAPRLGFENAGAMAKAYPEIKHLAKLEALVHRIGLGEVKFPHLRTARFLDDAGFPEEVPRPSAPAPAPEPASPHKKASLADHERKDGKATAPTKLGRPDGTARTTALPPDDPRSIKQLLEGWHIRADRRAKLAQLRLEAMKLRVPDARLIFCFAVRAMIELSVNAYIAEHRGQVRVVDKEGRPLTLDGLVKATCAHLNSQGSEMQRRIHDATVELKSPTNVLSITTLNRVHHSDTFVPDPTQVSRSFHGIFTLLEVLNE